MTKMNRYYTMMFAAFLTGVCAIQAQAADTLSMEAKQSYSGRADVWPAHRPHRRRADGHMLRGQRRNEAAGRLVQNVEGRPGGGAQAVQRRMRQGLCSA